MAVAAPISRAEMGEHHSRRNGGPFEGSHRRGAHVQFMRSNSNLSSCRSSQDGSDPLSETESEESYPDDSASGPALRSFTRQRSIHRRVRPLSKEQVDWWNQWLEVADKDWLASEGEAPTILRAKSWHARTGALDLGGYAGEAGSRDGVGRRQGPPGEEGGSAPATFERPVAGKPEEEEEEEEIEREEITKPRSAAVSLMIQRELERQPLTPRCPESPGGRGRAGAGMDLGQKTGSSGDPISPVESLAASRAQSPMRRDKPPLACPSPRAQPDTFELERQTSLRSLDSFRSEQEIPLWARIPMSPVGLPKTPKPVKDVPKKKKCLERTHSGEEMLSEGEWNPEDMRYVAAVVSALGKGSEEDQREVAAILRGLIKKQPQNKRSLVQAGGIRAVVNVMASSMDSDTLEHAVTTLLNTANAELCEDEVASCGGFEALVRVLKIGNAAAKANAAATMFMLGEGAEHRLGMCKAGAVLPLLRLMLGGTLRGKKDAALALYQLSRHAFCASEVAECGGVMALVGTLLEGSRGMEDKVAAVFANLAKVPEGRSAMEEQGAIPMLVDLVEEGSPRSKEDCVGALFLLANNSSGAFDMIQAEGMMSSLRVLSEKGTSKARAKAKALMEVLRTAGSSGEESGEFWVLPGEAGGSPPRLMQQKSKSRRGVTCSVW